MQGLRLIGMVLAVAGIIYAIEYVPSGIAVWFWVALLGIGFFGLLFSFRIGSAAQRCCSRGCTSPCKIEKT